MSGPHPGCPGPAENKEVEEGEFALSLSWDVHLPPADASASGSWAFGSGLEPHHYPPGSPSSGWQTVEVLSLHRRGSPFLITHVSTSLYIPSVLFLW